MRKILKNTPRTKKYLEKLPKLYGVFLWAKWAVVEVPWSGKRNKDSIPLVYSYYDGNGCCDEYHLMPVHLVSSGSFWSYFEDRAVAENIAEQLNKELVQKELV